MMLKVALNVMIVNEPWYICNHSKMSRTSISVLLSGSNFLAVIMYFFFSILNLVTRKTKKVKRLRHHQ